MAKITAPNKEYSGTIGSGIAFINGIGFTSDPAMVEWLARHGYGVEVEEHDPEAVRTVVKNMGDVAKVGTVDQTAVDLGVPVQRLGRPLEDASITKGLTDDARADLVGPGAGRLGNVAESPSSAPLMAPGRMQGPGGTVGTDEEIAKAYLEGRGYKVTATGAEGVREANENAAETSTEGSGGTPRSRNRSRKGGGTGTGA